MLICREVVVRRELGDKPSLGEYQTRFPDLAEELALQFEVDRMLNNSQNGSAPTPIDAALIANTELAPTFLPRRRRSISQDLSSSKSWGEELRESCIRRCSYRCVGLLPSKC